MAFAALETDRLRLRRFAGADLPALLAYRSDPRVARYQSWSGFTPDEARAFLEGQLRAEPGTPGGWFQFAMEERATGGLVGDCALHVRADEPRQGEVGFTLAREHQGRGLAAEGVRRVLDFAFGELGLHRITATVDCENAAAVALLERLGLRREGHFLQNVWFKGRWGDELLYALLRREWPRPPIAPMPPGSPPAP